MCGICGVWEYGAARGNVERALVERMRDVMCNIPTTSDDKRFELAFDSTGEIQ
jgi:hypothetical protein